MDEKVLSLYLDGGVSGPERERIEGHISQCDSCLDLLVLAYEAQEGKDKCPAPLKRKIKETLGIKQKKSNSGLKWLLAAICLFALSFVFKGYFLQFLVVASILGFKWVMEGEGAKKVVMIFKGIESCEKDFERKAPPYVSNKRGGDSHGEKQ